MNSFSFSVSMPPSSNNMFATVIIKGKPRRITSRAYKAWRKLEAPNLQSQWERCGSPKFARHLSLKIHLGLNYQSDVANREKAITDLLVSTIPDFPDDRYFDRVCMIRVPGIEGARVQIIQGNPPVADHPISPTNPFRGESA